MVLRLIEENKPLDEIIFFDTGMEFDAIYTIRDKVKEILKQKNIVYTELSPDKPFLHYMLEKEVTKRDGSKQCGYKWCGGACRWGTLLKVQAINRYLPKTDIHIYVGIAYDEPERLARLDKWKSSPLAEWKMTEKDCLEYCRNKGFGWDESGIDLYDILDRVSCWCCRNKNQKELRNIYRSLPNYWEKLKELQDKIGEPMKKYRYSKEYGNLSDLHNLEKMFADEQKQMSIFDLGIEEAK